MFNNFFFSENNALYENFEKHGTIREAADENMAERCMLDKATRAQAHAGVRAPTTTHPPNPPFPLHNTHTQWRNTHCFSQRASILC
jgi:hypothetical protein